MKIQLFDITEQLPLMTRHNQVWPLAHVACENPFLTFDMANFMVCGAKLLV